MTENSIEKRGAFESDTFHQMLTLAARYWLIEHFLRAQDIPMESETRFFYPFEESINWGKDVRENKRIRVTIEIEDWDPCKPNGND